MSYKKATQILPQELLIKVQEYIDGEFLYIPRISDNKKNWGDTTSTRQELHDRNESIYSDYLSGQSMDFLAEKFYRFSDYLGTTSQMSELLGISSISGILRFGRYPAYHGISEPHLAVKSSKTVVENRPYY